MISLEISERHSADGVIVAALLHITVVEASVAAEEGRDNLALPPAFRKP